MSSGKTASRLKCFGGFNNWVVPRDGAEIRVAEHNEKERYQSGVQIWRYPPISVFSTVKLVTGIFL
jgi:hypothetical protein